MNCRRRNWSIANCGVACRGYSTGQQPKSLVTVAVRVDSVAGQALPGLQVGARLASMSRGENQTALEEYCLEEGRLVMRSPLLFPPIAKHP